MILSTAETRFDFDAPRVSSDGSAVMTVRCFVGDALWGQREIQMSKADVDKVTDAETIPNVSRRMDIFIAFGQWLIDSGLIAGELEGLEEMKP